MGSLAQSQHSSSLAHDIHINTTFIPSTASMERTFDLYQQAINLSTDPKNTRWLSPLLLAVDALLCALIIWKVPCKPSPQSPAPFPPHPETLPA
jgi:hypothetical protein